MAVTDLSDVTDLSEFSIGIGFENNDGAVDIEEGKKISIGIETGISHTIWVWDREDGAGRRSSHKR
jgi:hypothetical protein